MEHEDPGVSLYGGCGEFSIPAKIWLSILSVAILYGWTPTGTSVPEEEWALSGGWSPAGSEASAEERLPDWDGRYYPAGYKRSSRVMLERWQMRLRGRCQTSRGKPCPLGLPLSGHRTRGLENRQPSARHDTQSLSGIKRRQQNVVAASDRRFSPASRRKCVSASFGPARTAPGFGDAAVSRMSSPPLRADACLARMPPP